MMDIRQLRYFVAIAEHGSFSRAAEFLHVAQPALSLHVRNMEAALGTPLLFRSPRGVVPTEAGVILLHHARTVLDQITVAEEEIRGHRNDPAGEVRLGLPGTIAEILAVPLITAVHARYPKIRLRIAEAMSGFVLEWMQEGRIDLAVLYAQAAEHGISTEALLEESLLFFGPPALAARNRLPPAGEPIRFATVTQQPLILPAKGHGLRELLNRQALSAAKQLEPVIEVDSYNNIKSLVIEGLGFSVLPENAIASDAAQGRLLSWPIAAPAIRRTVHLAHSRDRFMTNAVTAVRDLARETLCAQVRDHRWTGTTLLAPQGPPRPFPEK